MNSDAKAHPHDTRSFWTKAFSRESDDGTNDLASEESKDNDLNRASAFGLKLSLIVAFAIVAALLYDKYEGTQPKPSAAAAAPSQSKPFTFFPKWR